MCATSINSYDWGLSESQGKRPKPTSLPHMQLWFFCSEGNGLLERENHFIILIFKLIILHGVLQKGNSF